MVIDPFGANFIVDRKLSEHLKTKKDIMTKGVSEQKVEKDTTVWLGEPKVYPTEMIEAVKDHLQKELAVKKAWMRLISGIVLLKIQNLFIPADNEKTAIELKRGISISTYSSLKILCNFLLINRSISLTDLQMLFHV